MSWSLVQRSPTDCGALLCVIYNPCEWGGPGPLGAVAPNKKNSVCQDPISLCTQLFYKELSTFYYLTLVHHAQDFRYVYTIATGTCECGNEPVGSIKCREFSLVYVIKGNQSIFN